MARVKRGVAARKRHKKILKLAKGYRGRASKCFRTAVQSVEKGLQYQYRDRRNRKRDFRKVWIMRINAAARSLGSSYSNVICLLRAASININRKMLSEIAVRDLKAFSDIVEKAKKVS